jgi:hypothetical protein
VLASERAIVRAFVEGRVWELCCFCTLLQPLCVPLHPPKRGLHHSVAQTPSLSAGSTLSRAHGSVAGAPNRSQAGRSRLTEQAPADKPNETFTGQLRASKAVWRAWECSRRRSSHHTQPSSRAAAQGLNLARVQLSRAQQSTNV